MKNVFPEPIADLPEADTPTSLFLMSQIAIQKNNHSG